MEVPEFRLYGQGDPKVEQRIQPKLAPRSWDDVGEAERKTAFLFLRNKNWLEHSREILRAIEHLNTNLLSECPGKNLIAVEPEPSY